jgi:flagellar protein FliL
MATPPSVPPTDEVNPLERDEQILDQEPEPPKASQKVVLDLDDAPFLEEEPEEEEESEPGADTDAGDAAQTDPPPTEKSRSSRKTVLIIGALVAVLLLAGLAFWMTRSPPEPEPEPLPPPPPQEPLEPEGQEFSYDFEPFWVAYEQDETINFLSLTISVTMEEEPMVLELRRKSIVLRDAVYYFLNNRPLQYLKREEAADALKKDILSVLNQHLSRPLTAVFIEEYLVR